MTPTDATRGGSAWDVLGATFLRDMWTATSYRIGFLLSAAGSAINVVGLFFLSRTFGTGVSTSLERYGGDFFSFTVLGVAVTTVMALGLAGIGSRVREGQMMGTLELMVLSPNRLGLVLLSSGLWSHAQATLSIAVYLVAGVLLGMDLSRAHVPMALASVALSVAAFNALGLIAASVVIIIKQGNPVSLFVGLASALLAGVVYPVSVLPGWLQAVAQLLPLTHALELVRRSVLLGEGPATLLPSFLALTLLTAVLAPLGLWLCHRAVRIAQTDGSLSQY